MYFAKGRATPLIRFILISIATVKLLVYLANPPVVDLSPGFCTALRKPPPSLHPPRLPVLLTGRYVYVIPARSLLSQNMSFNLACYLGHNLSTQPKKGKFHRTVHCSFNFTSRVHFLDDTHALFVDRKFR